MPYLTVKPSLIAYNGYDVGLGNRMRVVLGAKSLAEHEGRRFYYVWPTGARFGPELADLWEFRGKTVSRATSRLLAKRYPYVDETLTWLDAAKRRERIWQIRTGTELALPPDVRPWAVEFRELHPVAAIAESVTRQFASELQGRPYVGVMIRAHAVSHTRTREASPVEWFVRRMREMLQAAPDTRFFVSCDVAAVQRQVMAEVPNCYGQSDKGAYNSVDGVRASVVDLYLLASSSYVLGPYYSSFVEMAIHLSDNRLVLETANDAIGDAVDLSRPGVVADPLRPSVRVPSS